MTLALQINGPVTNSTLASRGVLAAMDPYGLTRMLMDGVLERLEAAGELGEDGDPLAAGDLLEAAVLLILEVLWQQMSTTCTIICAGGWEPT